MGKSSKLPPTPFDKQLDELLDQIENMTPSKQRARIAKKFNALRVKIIQHHNMPAGVEVTTVKPDLKALAD